MATQALDKRIQQLRHVFNLPPRLQINRKWYLPRSVSNQAMRDLRELHNFYMYHDNVYVSQQILLYNGASWQTVRSAAPRRKYTAQQMLNIHRSLLRAVNQWWNSSPSGERLEVANGTIQDGQSRWRVISITTHMFQTSSPLGAYQPLPPALVTKRCLINPRVQSDCFMACCVLHRFDLGKNKTRESKLRSYFPRLGFKVACIDDVDEAVKSEAWTEVMKCNVALWKWDEQPGLVKRWDLGWDDCLNVLEWKGHCVYISKPHIFLANRRKPVCPNCFQFTGKHHKCFEPQPVVSTRPIKFKAAIQRDVWGVFDFESMIDSSGRHHPVCYCVSMNDGRKWEWFGLDAARHFIDLVKGLDAVLFAHNAKGYDNSLVMQALVDMPDVSVEILSQSTQRVTGLTIGKTRLVDSLSFLGGSLNACLEKAGLDCKLPYPYTLFKKLEDYDGPYCPIEAFDDELSGASITPEAWENGRLLHEACGGWKAYTIEYCRWDCDGLLKLLQGMNKQLEVQDMRVQDYWTLPSLAYAMMLKMTQLELQPIPSVDLYQFVEKGMRGGITQVSTQRYSDKDLLYLDVNSLYPTIMKHFPLPGSIEWVWDGGGDDVSNMSIEEDGLWEVDIEPTPAAWDDPSFLAMPHAPYLDDKGQGVRLICDMKPKTNYVETTRLLRWYVSSGMMRITKVHRKAKYTSFFSLAPFVDQCVELRKAHGDAYKLCMNSVFGKTCENSARYQSTKLVHDPHTFERLSIRLTNCVIFNQSSVLCMYTKKKAVLKSPLQVGQAILSYSKLVLYQMHSAVSRPGLSLLYTDTDSLIYECDGPKDGYLRQLAKLPCLFHPDQSMMDYSNQPDPSLSEMCPYAKVPGKLKDELPGVVVKESIFLNPKCYCIKHGEGKMVKAKGVPRPTMKSLDLEDYKSVLTSGRSLEKGYTEIASKDFALQTQKKRKVVLSAAYSKRRCEASHPYRTHPWTASDPTEDPGTNKSVLV